MTATARAHPIEEAPQRPRARLYSLRALPEPSPVVHAYRCIKTGLLRFWCDACDKWHFHGKSEGLRAAHCGNKNSPFYGKSYELKVCGIWIEQRTAPHALFRAGIAIPYESKPEEDRLPISKEHAMDEHNSTDMQARITATRAELASIDMTLATLPEKKSLVLGAESFDEKALMRLEEDEAKLTRRQQYLTARLPLLEKQREEEQARAAQARIAQLAEESTECVAAYQEVLSAFNSATDNLRLASEALVQGYLRVLGLHDEQQFLLELHEDARLIPVVLASAGPLPSGEDLQDTVFKPLKDFWRRSGSLAAGHTSWSKKLVSLQDERHARQQAALKQTIGGHVRTNIA